VEHAARRRTRRSSAKAFALSGRNMTPNWQTTASNEASANGSAVASAWRHSTLPAAPTLAATSSIAWLRSVATISADGGRSSRSARVTTPVPHATSRTRRGVAAATRGARSRAYGAKIRGTKQLS